MLLCCFLHGFLLWLKNKQKNRQCAVLPLLFKYLPFYLFVQCLKDKFGHGPRFPAWAMPGDDASDARAMCLKRKPFDRVSRAAPESIANMRKIT